MIDKTTASLSLLPYKYQVSGVILMLLWDVLIYQILMQTKSLVLI